MNLDTFLYGLHFDTDDSKPVDWEVDWGDAPLKYKLYRGLPAIPLSAEVPLALEGRKAPANPDLATIGHFLWYVFGLTQLSQLSNTANPLLASAGSVQMYRRFAPSGGGLYPNEIYVYLKSKEIPDGVYHYDAAHHRLLLIREGQFDAYLARSLGNRCDVSACFGIVFVSTMFWKNFYKYHNFAYRLQGLDTGIVIGQLLEVAKRFGFTSGVYFQFLDRAVNHLMGLSELEESVYAVIPLSAETDRTWLASDLEERKINHVNDLCRELPVIRHEQVMRSRKIKDYSMLSKMNNASMLESTEWFRTTRPVKNGDSGIRAVFLPRVNRFTYDLALTLKKRYSPETEFVMGKVTGQELAVLLQEATASFSYRNDLDGSVEKPNAPISLYVCLNHVEGVPDGAYRYDMFTHALRSILPGNHRLRLQQGMSLNNVNLSQVPFCFHVAGDNKFLKQEYGYRGYRILQMEAGMLVQRLLVAASAIGMGGRPLLGFNARDCDEIYGVAGQGKTCLIQLPIGFYRHRPSLEGGLHS